MTDIANSIKELEVNLPQRLIDVDTSSLITSRATTFIESDVVLLYNLPYFFGCNCVSNICLIVLLLAIIQFKLVS